MNIPTSPPNAMNGPYGRASSRLSWRRMSSAPAARPALVAVTAPAAAIPGNPTAAPPSDSRNNRLTLERDRYRQRAMLAEQQLETAEELIETQGKALALLQRFARKSASQRRPSGQNG